MSKLQRLIEHEGRTQSVKDWAIELGIEPGTLSKRLDKLSPEIALVPGRLNEWEHGTRAGYEQHKCRCDACRRANSVHHRKLYAQRKRAKNP